MADAKNALIEVIAEAAYAPEEDRRQELIHKYNAAGLDGPSTVWSTCMMVFEDDEETTDTKIATIGILNTLMELNEAALAQLLASEGHLQFFYKAAKKLSVKDDRSRLPEGFPQTADPQEVTAFITAVCELLDKYGRCFEGAPPPLKDFQKLRKDLAGQTGWPSPERYQYVNPNFSSAQHSNPAMGFSAPPSGSTSTRAAHGGFSEQFLESLIAEAHAARAQYGDGDKTTAEAFFAAQSELEKLQEAIFAAAERNDMDAMDRLTAADELYREMLGDYTPPPGFVPGMNGKSKSKKRQQDMSSNSFGGVSDPWGSQQSAIGWSEQNGTWPADSGMTENWSGTETKSAGRKTREELEAEVQTLQYQLRQAQDAYYRDGAGVQLQQAQRKISELESFQLLVVDAKTSLEHLTEVNLTLERELQHCRSQLQDARRVALEAEDKLIENEQLLTKQRAQLFAQNYSAVQLEEEVKKCEDIHGDLHDQLQAKKDQHRTHELELRRAQHAHQTSKRNPFGDSSQDEGKTPLQVLANEEIHKHSGTRDFSQAVLRRTNAEVWARTPHATAADTPVVMRHPPGSADWSEQASASFCNMLVRRKGCIYQDDMVGIELSVNYVTQGESRPVISFEVAVASLGGRPIHDVGMVAQKVGTNANFELRLQPQLGQDAGNVLWPGKVLRYWGELEVLGAFDEWPNVCFSYLLGDNLSCKALIRLPIAITRLLSAARLGKEKFVELWDSTERAHHEVAFVCYVREELLGFGSSHSWTKYLQFGGSLQSILGLDENPGSVVLAAVWTEHQDGKPLEVLVLVRAELGNPGSPGGRLGFPGVSAHVGRSGTPASVALRQQCRVAIRSTAHHVSKALAKIILEVIARPQM